MTADGGPAAAVEEAFDPVAFLEAAVAIDTTTDVEPLRSDVVDLLAAAGVDASVDDAGNIVATRGEPAGVAADDDADSGTDGDTNAVGPHLMLNTHLDTVAPHVPPSRDGDVLRGRGACDAGGPLAAMLAAFLAADTGAGRLTLALTPDEETTSAGAAALDVDADAVVVGEPTDLDVCTAARGRFQATVEVVGEGAHAAAPDAGVNAVAAAAPVLDALGSFDDREGAPPAHPNLGDPSLTPTMVEGGEAANRVPGRCRIVVDRRSVPPESAEGFRRALADHCRATAPGGATVAVSLADRETPFLGPWETPADARVVRLLREASGGDVRPFGAATEASYFADKAPTVVFGPGRLTDGEGPVAHAEREYVRLSRVRQAADALTDVVERYLG